MFLLTAEYRYSVDFWSVVCNSESSQPLRGANRVWIVKAIIWRSGNCSLSDSRTPHTPPPSRRQLSRHYQPSRQHVTSAALNSGRKIGAYCCARRGIRRLTCDRLRWIVRMTPMPLIPVILRLPPGHKPSVVGIYSLNVILGGQVVAWPPLARRGVDEG